MLPSAGSQYKGVASVQEVGALAKKGADKLAKGATVARKAQGQYVTGKYRELRKSAEALKGARDKQAQSLMAREKSKRAEAASSEMESFQIQKGFREVTAKRAVDKRAGEEEQMFNKAPVTMPSKAQQLKAGGGPRRAGTSVSAAQQRSSSGIRRAVSNVANEVKTEAVKETKKAVGKAVADTVNSKEFANKAKGVGAGIGAAAGAALTKNPKGAAVGAQIGTGAAEVVTKVAQNVVNKRAQRGKK